jgi:hypothetical protein
MRPSIPYPSLVAQQERPDGTVRAVQRVRLERPPMAARRGREPRPVQARVLDAYVLEALDALAVEPRQERQHHRVVEVQRRARDERALALKAELLVRGSNRWLAPPRRPGRHGRTTANRSRHGTSVRAAV